MADYHELESWTGSDFLLQLISLSSHSPCVNMN